MAKITLTLDKALAARTPSQSSASGNTFAAESKKDGKVMTITSKGADACGKPFNPVAVYDKQ